MSKVDKSLDDFCLMLMGSVWFGIFYGILANDSTAFMCGIGIWACLSPIAVYFFIKYKMWQRKN